MRSVCVCLDWPAVICAIVSAISAPDSRVYRAADNALITARHRDLRAWGEEEGGGGGLCGESGAPVCALHPVCRQVGSQWEGEPGWA